MKHTKWELPKGSKIHRWRGILQQKWELFATTKTISFTKEDLGKKQDRGRPSDPNRVCYVMTIPLTDGYDTIRVWQADFR